MIIILVIVIVVLVGLWIATLSAAKDFQSKLLLKNEEYERVNRENFWLENDRDTWKYRYDELSSAKEEEVDEDGEDYVRASLGLPSDDEKEILLIRDVMEKHQWLDTGCICGDLSGDHPRHVAQEISTALNGRAN